MKMKAQIARAPVVLTVPVAVPPRCATRPQVIREKNSANGIEPSRLQKRMKKKRVQRNGRNRSVCSLRAGRKTSTRRNSRIDSKKFLAPLGAPASGRLKTDG